MFSSPKWVNPNPEDMDKLLEDLYPNGAPDRRQYFTDSKSKMRLQLALDGCTFSMVWLAKKVLTENPKTDGIAMELAFRWLLKAARGGDETAVAMLVNERRYCPQILAPFVDNVIEQGYSNHELATTYSRRIASRFKKMYSNADEDGVAAEVCKLVSGDMPKCESLFAQCFENTFGDLVALAVTIMVGGLTGLRFLSAFDHLLSHKLAPMMDAFFAFLCTLLLIVSIRTYSTLFTCGMYSKVMALDAKYRDRPLPFRLRIWWTKIKLHLLSLFCAVCMIILSVLSFAKVSLTVFSCTTYMITMVDVIQHLHLWATRSRVPEQYIGRYPLLLKLISTVCMSCLFSLTKSEWQDTIITLSMTLVACSLIYLLQNCSVFTFVFLTCEYSPILQGLSILKTLIFLFHRHVTYHIPKTIKILLVFLMILYAFHKVPSGLLFTPKDTSPHEIYNACRTTSTLKEMVECSRLEGMRVNATCYMNSIRLVSRSNLQEASGLETWSLDDGFVQLGVGSFEKLKVEVKLSTSYFAATAILDDDALEVLRHLKANEYITVDGVIESARQGPSLHLMIHAVEYNGRYLEVKRLGTAVRHYWKHIHDVLEEWKDRTRDLTPSEPGGRWSTEL